MVCGFARGFFLNARIIRASFVEQPAKSDGALYVY